MDEYEYNVLQRDSSYVDTVKDMIVAYRLYFARGADILAELEESLQLPTVRRPALERKPKRYQPTKNNRTTLSRQAEERFLNQKVYGSPLEDVMQRENEVGEVPQVFEYLANFIEANGISIEGIFRISGDSTEISICKKRVDKGLPLEFDPGNHRAIHNAASLLKQYIRELPDPLLTFDKYGAFTAASQLPPMEEKIHAFEVLLEDLPPYNALVLNSLCDLLCKVESRSEENKMTFANLSIVFGMNIVHPEDTSNPLMLIQDSKKMNDTCQFLLEHYATRFRPILIAHRARMPEKKAPMAQQSQEAHDEVMTTTAQSSQNQERRFLPPPTSLAPATAFTTTKEKPSRPLPKPPQVRSSLPRPPRQAHDNNDERLLSKTPPTIPASRPGKALPAAPRYSLPPASQAPKIYPQVRASTPMSSSSSGSDGGGSMHFDIAASFTDEYFNEVNPYGEDAGGIYPSFQGDDSDEDLLQY